MELKIVKIVENNYTLISKTGETFNFFIYFYNLAVVPHVNDTITMHKNLLTQSYEEYSNTYRFGALNSPSGRKITSNSHPDLIKLNIQGNVYLLKRVFG